MLTAVEFHKPKPVISVLDFEDLRVFRVSGRAHGTCSDGPEAVAFTLWRAWEPSGGLVETKVAAAPPAPWIWAGARVSRFCQDPRRCCCWSRGHVSHDCPSGISHSCWQLGLGHSPLPYRMLSSIWASAHHVPSAVVVTKNIPGPCPVSSGGWNHCYLRTAALEYIIQNSVPLVQCNSDVTAAVSLGLSKP